MKQKIIYPRMLVFLIGLITGCQLLPAQIQPRPYYPPRWDSLDARPIPEWFLDAKLGIFIHWGVYSVPSFAGRTEYAEWYYYGLKHNQEPRRSFHDRVYGPDFTYEQFAPMFHAELWNPDDWADLFVKSGARYVVLTSKHHDGFCLWPSKFRPGWNSIDTGPRRDLVGDLSTAVKSKGLKMGLYYSLMEWTNPLYTWSFPKASNNLNAYITQYMIPQIHELVDRYRPDVLWADGEWTESETTFQSQEILSWLYNNPKLDSNFVTNDRWGANSRLHHGGYFTTEYTQGLEASTHPWEECRGMGHSFGYNRNEQSTDYLTADSLVRMLVRLVSNGGNLLLNIGPASDGRIPEIMQDRLLGIGKWLDRNGHAIYNSRKWDYTNDGPAICYTQSKDHQSIFAIALTWPDSVFKLRRVKPADHSVIRLQGVSEPLDWKYDAQEGLSIFVPDRLRQKFPCPYDAAYAFEIHGSAAPASPVPEILSNDGRPLTHRVFIDTASIILKTSNPDAKIYYTIDGSRPTYESAIYEGSIRLHSSAMIRAFSQLAGCIRSDEISYRYEEQHPLPALKPAALKPGLLVAYAEQQGMDSIPDIGKLSVMRTGVSDSIKIPEFVRSEHFVLRFSGTLSVPTRGIYTFSLRSDDGSKLSISGQLVVDNNYLHGAQTETGEIALDAGYHPITLDFFQASGDKTLSLKITGPGLPQQEIPAAWLVHE